MPYWVLKNSKGSYAKIHLATCHTCNNGYGPNHGHNGSGSWQGPFATYNEAYLWALGVRKYVESCKFCKPKKNN